MKVQGGNGYFEVSNLFLRRSVAVKIVRRIPGVEVLYARRPFSFGNPDIFCRFRLGSRTFELWEPWSDSDRFHVSESTAVPSDELLIARTAFEQHANWPQRMVNLLLRR
jgi:hypothetical protein